MFFLNLLKLNANIRKKYYYIFKWYNKLFKKPLRWPESRKQKNKQKQQQQQQQHAREELTDLLDFMNIIDVPYSTVDDMIGKDKIADFSEPQ